MNLIQQFIGSPFNEKLGWCLLHSLWQIALVGLVLKILLDLVGHRSSTVRYNLGIVAMLFAMLCPVLTWFVVATPEHTVARESTDVPVQPTNADLEQIQNTLTGSDSVAVVPPELTADYSVLESEFEMPTATPPVITSLNEVETPSPWTSWIACGWLAGILIFSVRPFIGISVASKLRRLDRTPVPGWVQRSVARLTGQLGITRVVQVSHSRLVNVPTLVGLIRPIILLPASSLTNLSASELEAILLHELAHVRRFDQFANLLQTLIETLLFFHPFVWWMSQVVRRERENCCDDMAVMSCGDSNSLVRALVTLEEKRNASYGLAGMSSNGGSLLSRIKRLADPSDRPGSSAVSLLSTIAVLVVTVTFAATLSVNSVNADQPGSITAEDLEKLKVTSLSDLYQWDNHSITDPRLIYRFWNMFPPEKRDQRGETIDGWKPDLEFEFTLAAKNGESSKTEKVQVGLQDGFRWSVGNGVWLMDSQWPMRYSLNNLIRQSREEQATRQKQAAVDVTETRREKLFNDHTWQRDKESLVKNHSGRWVAIVDGRVFASYDSFEDCVAAADEANRHASHRYIFRPGIDDQPQEFAHSPWITGQPNWWQLGIQFRQDHLITTAADRWIAGGKTLRTDADGKGNVVLTSPGNGATETEKIRRPAVCSGMVGQQMTIIADDVQRLRLDRFAVPGEVRCLTYQVSCSKVHLEVSIDELGIKQTVVAFVVPQATVDLDPPGNQLENQLPSMQIEWSPQADSPETTTNPPVQDRTQELIDLFRNVDANLNQSLRKANDEYNKIRGELDTTSSKRSGTTFLPLHHTKVRDLDQQLTKLRGELTIARQEQEYVDKAIAQGSDGYDLMIWILIQEGLLKPEQQQEVVTFVEGLRQKITELETQKDELSQKLGGDHPDMKALERQIAHWKSYIESGLGAGDGTKKTDPLQPDEIIRRYKIKVDRQVAKLEARFKAINEEFKFHFERAKRLEEIESRLQKKQEEIDMIKDWLSSTRQNMTKLDLDEFRQNSANDSQPQPISESYRLQNTDSAILKVTIEQIYQAAYETNNGKITVIAFSPRMLAVVGQPRAQNIVKELIGKLDVKGLVDHQKNGSEPVPVEKTETDKPKTDKRDGSPPQIISLPDETLEGSVKIKTIPELNAVFLIGNPQDVQKVKAMMEQIIRPANTDNGAHDDSRRPQDDGRTASLDLGDLSEKDLASLATEEKILDFLKRANINNPRVISMDEIDTPVKIRVVPELSAIILIGNPADIAIVREFIKQHILRAEGRIISTAPTLGKVVINLGSADELKTGQTIDVFDQGNTEFLRGQRKARLQVSKILDHHLAECRITMSGADPILTQDHVVGVSRVSPNDADDLRKRLLALHKDSADSINSVKIHVRDDWRTIVVTGKSDEDVAKVKQMIRQILQKAGAKNETETSSDSSEKQESGKSLDHNQLEIDLGSNDELKIGDPVEILNKTSETWTVNGTITSAEGDPLSGVKVWASTGMGSLRRTGEAESDENGKYSMTFGPGFLTSSEDGDTVGVQAATIVASLDGHSEINLCRQGDRLMAAKTPSADTAWGTLAQMEDKLIIKGQPVTIDFVMKPAAKIEGYLVDQDGHLLQRRSLSITGPELPPSSNVYEQVHTDLDGRFVFNNVPVGKRWRIILRAPGLRDGLLTAEFELDDAGSRTAEFEFDHAGSRNWVLTLDSRRENPALLAPPISDELATKLAGQSRENENTRIVAGQPYDAEDGRNLNWGDKSIGLQAALYASETSTVSSGELVDCELVVRNVSDETIRFESANWRQGDKLMVWSIGENARKQDVESIQRLGRATYKIYLLEPGEVVSIACGKLAVTSPREKMELPPRSRSSPDWADSFVPYRCQLAAGTYNVSLRARIPSHRAESDSWRGSLTTGDIEIEVK